MRNILARKINLLLKKINPHFGLKKDDIILASYPKSGNTWVRFIWTHIICICELTDVKVNFQTLNDELDANYDQHSYGTINYKILPRLVKTHHQYDDFFNRYKKIYLIRNPEDVMVSYFKYSKANLNNQAANKGISRFIRDSHFGIHSWCRHANGWIKNADIVVRYEDLKDDTNNVVTKMLHQLSIDHVKESVIQEAIQLSSFENMRKIEKKYGRPSRDQGEFDHNYFFVRKGKVGDGRNELATDDINYIKNKVKNNITTSAYEKYISYYYSNSF